MMAIQPKWVSLPSPNGRHLALEGYTGEEDNARLQENF
jgi:hypothetical protein